MRKAKSSVVPHTGDIAALPPDLAQAAAAMGAMSAGPAPAVPARMTHIEGPEEAAFAAAAAGPHLEAGPAPARAGQRKGAEPEKSPVRGRAVKKASTRRKARPK